MRISDWSSDVCSSDLRAADVRRRAGDVRERRGVAVADEIVVVIARSSLPPPSRGRRVVLSGSVNPAPAACPDNCRGSSSTGRVHARRNGSRAGFRRDGWRSEEHTSELQSLMRLSYAVFCLQKNKYIKYTT